MQRSPEMCRGVQRCAEGYRGTWRGTEVHGRMCRCVGMCTEIHRGVHGGAQRRAQRCVEVHGGVQRYTEGVWRGV